MLVHQFNRRNAVVTMLATKVERKNHLPKAHDASPAMSHGSSMLQQSIILDSKPGPTYFLPYHQYHIIKNQYEQSMIS